MQRIWTWILKRSLFVHPCCWLCNQWVVASDQLERNSTHLWVVESVVYPAPTRPSSYATAHSGASQQYTWSDQVQVSTMSALRKYDGEAGGVSTRCRGDRLWNICQLSISEFCVCVCAITYLGQVDMLIKAFREYIHWEICQNDDWKRHMFELYV